MIKTILLVGLGGGAGSVLRYFCQKWVYYYYPHPFPWGTFFVNVTGCFLIGILFSLSEKSNMLNVEWRLLLITGFCGGYTTFSAFSFENLILLKSGDLVFFLLNTALSVISGIAAILAGIALIKLL